MAQSPTTQPSWLYNVIVYILPGARYSRNAYNQGNDGLIAWQEIKAAKSLDLGVKCKVWTWETSCPLYRHWYKPELGMI